MTADDIEDLETYPKQINYFLSCVVVDRTYRKSPALRMMLHHYLDVLNRVEQRGICINAIIMDTVTADGNRFAERFGMRRVCESDHHTCIYNCDYETFKHGVNSYYVI